MNFLQLPPMELLQDMASRYSELDPSAVQSLIALIKVAERLNAAMDVHFSRFGLSRGRYQILLNLMHKGHSLAPAELADCCGVTRSTMTGLLDTLEGTGFVEREASTEDRRTVKVRITDAGKAHMENMLPEHYRRISTLMHELSEDERAELVRLLGKVFKALPDLSEP